MASIEERDLANFEHSYRVTWREDGRRRNATFYDRHEAQDFKTAVERNGNRVPADWLRTDELLAGAAGRAARVNAAPLPTLLEAAITHTTSKNTKAQPEHRMKMQRNFERHLDELGAKRVDRVTTADVQAWCDALAAEDYKYKTIKNLRSDVSTVFKYLEQDGVVPRNPVKGTSIDADPDDGREPVFLEHYEFDAIAGFLSGEDLVYVELLAATGMRKGEAIVLRVGDVRLLDASPNIRVIKSLKHGHDGNHRIGKPKTRSGIRTIPIVADLVEILRRHMIGRAPTELLFPEHGNDGTWQRNIWVPAINASGLPAERRPRIHDLRHTAASWMLAEGAQLFVVSRVLGHADIQTTANTYGHLDQGSAAEAVARVAEARARSRRAQLHLV